MEEAVNNLLVSIKSGIFNPNYLDDLDKLAKSTNCTFIIKRLDVNKCFGCNAILNEPSIKLPRCHHKVCSVACLEAETQLQGKDRAKCRHCLRLIESQEISSGDLHLIEPIYAEKPKFTCNICTDEFLVEESITLTCEHRFCIDCITGHIENLLEEGKVESSQVKCPLHNCTTEITYNEARTLLRPEQFERLDMLMTDRFFPTLENERMV